MNTTIRRFAVLLLAAALLMGSAGLVACAEKAPILAELEGNAITVDVYQFMLSRVKGTLGRSGYSINNDDFWEMIVDKDGTTQDEYFRQAALTDARRYLAAQVLFDEEKLSLSDATLDAIDEEIEGYIREAGSKSELNRILSGYGVNMDTLRDIYIMEAKFKGLQEHYYGKDGAKVDAGVRLDYLKENAVAFRQVLVRAFGYVYEVDTNGDEIYFLKGANNGKVNNIAYDKENGKPREDEYGKTIVDKNGETVYYLENGDIAYDEENGTRAYVYDEQGIRKTVKYSDEKIRELKSELEAALAAIEPGDRVAFEALLEEYSIDKDDEYETDGALGFLYTTGDNGFDYLNDLADELNEVEVGEICWVYSEYGYNVAMRYEIPEDAVTNTTAYEGWFTDLGDRVVAELFHNKCAPYMEQVTVSDEEFAALPSMKDVEANYYY